MAWRHGFSVGYGYGKEIDASYFNQGPFIHAILYRFNNIDKFLIFTLNASAGFWTAGTKQSRKVNTIAFSPNFRAYFVDPKLHRIRPYLQGSFGLVYMTKKNFGTQKLGSRFAFQTTIGGGIEFGSLRRAFDFSVYLIHYCNAGIVKPNDGTDIPIVVSLGYLF